MKQYIIFDLEATCWEKRTNNNISEIIEIGAVRAISNETGAIEMSDTFQTFIRPTQNPILSEFCVQLTSITQKEVDNAPLFSQGIYDFETWINKIQLDPVLISWGYYDKNQLLNECAVKHYHGNINHILDQHHSLKHDYAKMKKTKAFGMAKALELLKIPLEGTHHRGIDDAKNIYKIFNNVYTEWIDYISK